MTHPLSPTERAVYGENAVRHPITGLIIEQGSGALSPYEQAVRLHLPQIAATQGVEVAAAMRSKLDAAKAAVPPAETVAVSAERAPANAAPAATGGAQAKITAAQLAQNESDALKRKRDEKFAAAKAAYDAKVAAARAEFDAVSTLTPKN